MATTVAANPHKAPLRMQASIRSSGGDCQSAIAVPAALDGTHLGTTLAPTQALALPSSGATSPLVAAPHLAAVGTAEHLSLPLLSVLARISLAVALREATETQTGSRGQDAVGDTEHQSSVSAPDVAVNVVSIGRKRFDRRGTTRYGPSRPGGVRSRCIESTARGLGARQATEVEGSMVMGDGS